MVDFIKELNIEGCDVYVVGGYVRDNLMRVYHDFNSDPKDVDLCIVNKNLDSIGNILEKFGKVKKVGKSFGIITFKPFVQFNNFTEFDVAVPRKEISTGFGYRDFDIDHGKHISLKEDLIRRDFTINAMAYKLNNLNDLNFLDNFTVDNLVDVSNGFEDLKNKIIKAVGEPYERFKEDGTRILRGLRQCVKLNFKIDDNTFESIKDNLNFLEDILKDAPVRVTNELLRLINSNNYDNIDLLYSSGIYKMFNFLENLKEINKEKFYELSLPSKLFILVNKDNFIEDNKNLENWIKKYDLTACPFITKNQVNVLRGLFKGYKFIKENQNIIEKDMNYMSSKFCVTVDKNLFSTLNKDYFYELFKILDYYFYNMSILKKFIDKVISKYTMPRSEAQLLVTGYDLMKNKVKSKDIGHFKKSILEAILKEECGWSKEDQITYMNKITNVYLNL